MRLVIAPDSFKECLGAPQVAEAIAAGVREAAPDAEIDIAPVADGGEGTAEALVTATGGRFVETFARDPLGHRIEARYGILGDGKTAVLDVAEASGLQRIPVEQRNPGFTTSYGTGQLVCHAMEQGVATIVVGLGGSGTNDAGAGMAQALGYQLRDADDRELPFGGFALARLDFIESMKRHQGLQHVDIVGAYDVSNPLCGPEGASYVYAPQKGATPKTCELLDNALHHFETFVREDRDVDLAKLTGAGAAGGLGAGLVVFCDATLKPGFEVVSEHCELAERIAAADLVVTGEGRLDSQTLYGKAPFGVATMAQRAGVRCVLIAGVANNDVTRRLRRHGITDVYSLTDLAGSSEASLREPERFLREAGRRLLASPAA